MTDVALQRAQDIGGNIGYVLMGIGNALLIFFIITIGLDNVQVFADFVWVVVLDSSLVLVEIYHRFWKKGSQ